MIVAVTKKRFLLIASLPLTIAVTLGVLAILPPSPGVTKANFDRIEKGMTIAEVEQIFGEKGTASSSHPFLPGLCLRGELTDDGLRAGVWVSGESHALILFSDKCVVHMRWLDFNPTLLETIRRWLHLP